MFWITRDPSSGSFIQCLAKITVMVLFHLLIWTVGAIAAYLPMVCVRVLHSVVRHMLKQFQIFLNIL